jgi:electron transfer flavoprotein beta subunit
MNVLVPIKRVPDPDTRIRLLADASAIDPDGVKFTMNPFDAIALEEGLRLRERLPGTQIMAVSVGTEVCAEQLQSALAMGADRAVLVLTGTPLDSLGVAKALAKVYERERPNLVLMGKLAIDDDSNQAGQMLAGLLGLPQATFVSKIELTDNGLRCSRETDSGIEVVEVALPAVVTTDLRLNEPRYISLPSIMKAKRKPIERIDASALGADVSPRATLIRLESPPKRKAGIRVKSVEELLNKLGDMTGVV